MKKNKKFSLSYLIVIFSLITNHLACASDEGCEIKHSMLQDEVALKWLEPSLFDYSVVSIPHPRNGTSWKEKILVSKSQLEKIKIGPAKVTRIKVTKKLKEKFINSYISDKAIVLVGAAAGFLTGGTAYAVNFAITAYGLSIADSDTAVKKVAEGLYFYHFEEIIDEEYLRRVLVLKVGNEILTAVDAKCKLNLK